MTCLVSIIDKRYVIPLQCVLRWRSVFSVAVLEAPSTVLSKDEEQNP